MSNISFNKQNELATSIRTLNEQLENSVNSASNRAFNLGCFIGIIPIIFFVIISYFLTGKSWVGATVILVLMMLGLILIANMIARTTRINTLKRVYQEDIRPRIDLLADQSQLNHTELYKISLDVLEPGAPLRDLLAAQEASPGEAQEEFPQSDTDSVRS